MHSGQFRIGDFQVQLTSFNSDSCFDKKKLQVVIKALAPQLMADGGLSHTVFITEKTMIRMRHCDVSLFAKKKKNI